MKEIALQIIYSSLISIVPSTIAMLVPLAGAFWIFKVREKTVAEGKIFELGREIANLIQSREIRGPMEGIAYSYIDKARQKIPEKNREKALKELLRANLYYHNYDGHGSAEAEIEAANILVALATERVQSLAPPNIKWTGKGGFYSIFGEDIETKDNYFPFGTRLYRLWVEKFGSIYNDLWAICESRRHFVDKFVEERSNQKLGIDKKFIDDWLDEIDARIKSIHPIHAKLLTQIQIIDTQIDLPRLARDIGLISFYSALLTVVGFFVPKLITLSEQDTLVAILSLTVAAALSYSLIAFRIISAVQPTKDRNVHIKVYLPRLLNELKGMEKQCLRYKPYTFNDVLSLDADLKLNSQLKERLVALVERIDIFNEYGSIYIKKLDELIKPIEDQFITEKENLQSFGIDIFAFVSQEYDLEAITSRIMKEDTNFVFYCEEIHSSRHALTVNLTKLDSERRMALCERIIELRTTLQTLPLYKTICLSWSEVQEVRRSALIKLKQVG